jgi:chromate transporter
VSSSHREVAAGGPAPRPTFASAARLWTRIGLTSFGGPGAQIALLQDELVVRRGWVSAAVFSRGLGLATLLPGPEAHQLATYLGFVLHGVPGALLAGVMFVLPGAALLWALSVAVVWYGSLGVVAGVLWGMKAVVVAIIGHAVYRLGVRVVRGRLELALAAAGLAASLAGVPFPLLVLLAMVVGAVWLKPEVTKHDTTADSAPDLRPAGQTSTALLTSGVLFGLWWLAVLLLLVVMGRSSIWTELGLFFSVASMVTFGGAYAVLAFVAQYATGPLQWLTPAEMATGLALAETTPGPLILVLQYVGFMAGWNASGGSLAVATGAAALTSWVTFVPSLVWILAAAPFLDRLMRWSRLAGALRGVSAAVVGVVAALGVHLAGQSFFPAGLWGPASADYWAMGLCVLAGVALFSQRLGMVAVVLLGGAVGAMTQWI